MTPPRLVRTSSFQEKYLNIGSGKGGGGERQKRDIYLSTPPSSQALGEGWGEGISQYAQDISIKIY